MLLDSFERLKKREVIGFSAYTWKASVSAYPPTVNLCIPLADDHSEA